MLPEPSVRTQPSHEPGRHAAEELQPPPADLVAPVTPAQVPVAPMALPAAGSPVDTEAEAGAQPSELLSPAPVPPGSVAPEPGKDGEAAARPKKPRAPKPAPKPDEKRWVQTR